MNRNTYLTENPLDRVKLLMKYDLSITKTENVNLLFEQPMYVPGGNPLDATVQAKMRDDKEQEEIKKTFDEKFDSIPIPPNDFNLKQLIVPKGTKVEYSTKEENLQNRFFSKWLENPTRATYVPSEEELEYIFPENKAIAFVLPDGTIFLAQVRRVSDDPLKWKFSWFVDDNNSPYNQEEILGDNKIPKDYLDPEFQSFWDKWGSTIIQGLTSAALVILFPGTLGLVLSLAVDLVPAVQSLAEKDYPGAAISAMLALVSFGIAKIPGVGTITKQEANFLASKFANAKTEQEIISIYNGLNKTQKNAFQRVFSQDPQKFFQYLEPTIMENIRLGIQQGQYTAKELVNIINKKISEGIIKYDDVVKWYQKANMKRFGVELGASGLVVGSVVGYGLTKKSVSDLVQTDRDPSQPITKKESDDFDDGFSSGGS